MYSRDLLLTKFENFIMRCNGQQFEDFFGLIIRMRCPHFRGVKAFGSHGDGKNDGFDPTTGTFYQCFSPEDILKRDTIVRACEKMEEDFIGLYEQWSPLYEVNNFYFVINDKKAQVPKAIHMKMQELNLRKKYRHLHMEIFDSFSLEEEFLKLSFYQQCRALGVPVPDGESEECEHISPDIKKSLWQASRDHFLLSKAKHGRFESLHIIDQLLPKGYLAPPDFVTKGTYLSDHSRKVSDLCQDIKGHIALIGDGGIGKTTYLHHFMSEVFSEERPIDMVPFFIELNRCPEQIHDWYEDSLHKTNFITRYIGQLLENHMSMDKVSSKTLAAIEKEFQKIPVNGKPAYTLLLDGFNEVRSDENLSIRTDLSQEISVLSTYKNVRIITTSRETQGAYYASAFENIRIVGLEDADILDYLRKCHISETKISLIFASKPLVRCLRVPLYLCMFCASSQDSVLPETPGEILYFFFHRNSEFYNIRKRATETRTNPLTEGQTMFVLDFVLPYIGWYFEKNDLFSVNEFTLEDVIDDAITFVKHICQPLRVIPYGDFHYRSRDLLRVIDSFEEKKTPASQQILHVLYDYLGILYFYELSSGYFAERNRYAFGHHQFRDYFSAMWDVQLLRLLSCIKADDFKRICPDVNGPASPNDYLNSYYWPHHKTEFISQILMEHRNRPVFDEETENWNMAPFLSDEQGTLALCLDFCRELCKEHTDIHYLLQNILSSMLDGRKELSGMNLSHLDFASCNFFNVTCYRKGKSSVLAADFRESKFYDSNFQPENHVDTVIEYIYHNKHCYTLDDGGCIKCWDLSSGRLDYELFSGDPSGLHDLSATGFMAISPDGRWLAVKSQDSTAEGMKIGVHLFCLDGDAKECLISPDTTKKRYKSLDHLSFTRDSLGMVLVCDKNYVLRVRLEDGKIISRRKYGELSNHTSLYANSLEGEIYAFSSQYNSYEWEFSWEDDEVNEAIPCSLLALPYKSSHARRIYNFSGVPETSPTATYFSEMDGWLLFNYDSMQIEYVDNRTGQANVLLEEITLVNDMPPMYIHPHDGYPTECYLMYPDNIYLYDFSITNGNGILMHYNINGVKRLLPDSEQEADFYFKTSVKPYQKHFLVTDDSYVYEWDADKDRLLPRYNTALYNCLGLYLDQDLGKCILVHQYNGVSVFSGETLGLDRAFCFHERDYSIGQSHYHPATHTLALVFVRSDHEKVLLLDITNSKQTDCFASLYKDETIVTTAFDETGKELLICSQYQCLLCEIETGTHTVIRTAGPNERLVGAGFKDSCIEVCIVQHEEDRETSVDDRCETYKERNGKFYLDHYFLLPELTDEMYQYFIFSHGDLGREGTHGKKHLQNFWVTEGFFLADAEKHLALPLLRVFDKNGRPLESKQIKPHQMYYFAHKHALENIITNDSIKKGISFGYLNEKSKECIFMKNSEKFFCVADYTACTYADLEYGFSQNIGNYNGYAFWDFAIPWTEHTLVACYENYHLMELDVCSGEEIRFVEYRPGIVM